MIACPILTANVPVDASIHEPCRRYRIQQQMIEPQSRIARPTLPLIVPERKHRLRGVHRPNGIDPSLFEQSEGFSGVVRAILEDSSPLP